MPNALTLARERSVSRPLQLGEAAPKHERGYVLANYPERDS